MKIPFFDWPGLYAEREANFDEIITSTLRQGGFILQSDVDLFEAHLAEYVGAEYAVALSDGTNAILLGLRASNLEPGDEILITSHSFIAAPQSIYHAGFTPVPVELSMNDWLMDVEKLEERLSPKTKAIMPVHVNGRVCQMDKILEFAQNHDLLVFEDAAQAMGAKYDNICAGNFGLWGTYSFYPSKTLGSFGDAGALVTNSREIYKKVKSMRNHGADDQKMIPLDIDHWGTNCRMYNVHAAILNYKLGYYDEVISRRRLIADKYHKCLSEIDGVSLPPAPSSNSKNFDIYQNFEFCTERRDDLRAFLSKNGVGTIVQWGGFALHHLKNLVGETNLPLTDKFFETSMLLPLNHIMTDEEVTFVCSLLKQFYED